ncbi:MAG: MGMT family protein [Bacteroidetes bacterium]|nr:MAG: MGMT family protein [Bacteroidota bacterium]
MSKGRLPDDFYENVYDVVRLIPPGRVTNYGAIARYLGSAGSARIVGYALNQCAGMPDVPAHRVVNRNGLLTGSSHFPPERSMEESLMAEGVVVLDNQVQEFERLFWDPSVELEL